jgi:glycosyltransferase involved in cell wall biosynthesis
MSKLRVLLLLHEMSLTGAPRVILDALDVIGDQLDLRMIALKGGPLEPDFHRYGPVSIPRPGSGTPGPSIRDYARTLFSKAVNARLSQQIAVWRPQVIYANTVVALRLVNTLRLPKVPVILHVHELSFCIYAYTRTFPKLLRDWPTHYIAASKAVEQCLVRESAIDPSRITIIPEFSRADIASADHQPREERNGVFIVGGAGVPQWRKGIELWLHTAAELQPLLPNTNFQFMWVGVDEGTQSYAFREMARKLDLDSMVHFVPATNRPFEHFRRFDVFCMTSWEDPCPLVVLENMMLGKPVLCFAGGGGAPEEVGDAGIVIPRFSPRLMAEAIRDLVQAPDRLAALGRAAQDRVRSHFSAAVLAPKILECIKRTASTSPG